MIETLKKSHTFSTRVYHVDTDCYNMVWHGAYIKWLEIGRVEFIEMLGFKLKDLEINNILFPVVDLNIKYKNPAILNDILTIETTINDLSKVSIEFRHLIKNQNLKEIIIASTKIVTIHNGKLLKKMPEYIFEAFFNTINY